MTILPFDSLSPRQLYQLLKLRFDIFVLEQTCFYDEFDEVDYDALHFFIEKDDSIVAYLRLYRKTETVVSFGRLVVHPDFRGKGLAEQLIQKSIDYAVENMAAEKMVISAQEPLQNYYGRFGFVTVSDAYDDEGILHVDMERGVEPA